MVGYWFHEHLRDRVRDGDPSPLDADFYGANQDRAIPEQFHAEAIFVDFVYPRKEKRTELQISKLPKHKQPQRVRKDTKVNQYKEGGYAKARLVAAAREGERRDGVYLVKPAW
eukprot:1041463-Alexandrium_andersonii.AAC.1